MVFMVALSQASTAPLHLVYVSVNSQSSLVPPLL